MRHPVVRYGLALAVVGVAGVLRGFLGTQFPVLVPFATLFPAVLIATLLGGLGPGLLATALSALLAWLFALPPSAPLSPMHAMLINLALFVLVSLALVATAEAARRYHDRSLAGERRFRAAEELAVDGFGILEAVRDRRRAIVDFRWAYVNPAMLKLLHVAGADLVGRRLLEQLPGQRSHPALFPSYVRVVETGEATATEAFCDADGMRGWFRISAVRLDDGIALSLRDVTERKEREAARQESDERFRLLADAVDDVFWIIDVRQQKVVYVSPAYERVWGFSAEHLYRDPKAWREHLHPQDRALAEQTFDQMLAGRCENFELVYRLQSASGPRWVRDKAWLVRSGDGDRIAGTMTDVSAEKAAEEKQRLLSQELNHRLKNSFALMQSIVRLSAQSARDLGEFARSLEARIQALARGQDVLVKGLSQVADLADIVREIVTLHAGRESQVQIEGPPVQVAAGAVPLFDMGLHELATNATKYGALSVPGGKVSVRWQIEAGEEGQALRLVWRERGGPAVREPAHRGFGSMLIEQALAAEFGGQIDLAFAPEGVSCTMRLPFSERLMVSRNAA